MTEKTNSFRNFVQSSLGTFVFWSMSPLLVIVLTILYLWPISFIAWLIDLLIGKPVLANAPLALNVIRGLGLALGIATIIYLWKRWRAPVHPSNKPKDPQ